MLLGVPCRAFSGYGRSFRGGGAGSTDAHHRACYRSSMRITIRRSSCFIRDPEASAGHLLPAFEAALSVRIKDTLREMGPRWARDGPIVTPQWSRAVPRHLCGARASVSEILFTHQTRENNDDCHFQQQRRRWQDNPCRACRLLCIRDGLSPALGDLCCRGSMAVIAQ